MVNTVDMLNRLDLLGMMDMVDMMDMIEMVDIIDIVDMIDLVDMVDTKSQHTLIIRMAKNLELKNRDGLSYKILHPKAIKSNSNKHLMTTSLFMTKAMSTRPRVATIKGRQRNTTS